MRRKGKKKIILILVLVCVLAVSFTKIVHGNSKVSYDNIVVYKGDTLWSIALKYNPKNKDVRKTLYEIQKINNLNTVIITPGQELIVPIYQ